MGWQAWVTAGLVAGALVVLALGRFAADLVLLGVVAILLALGVLDPGEAARGFSNPGLITVALLYVVAAGLQETGAIGMLTSRLLGRPRTALGAQARLMLPVAAMSGFVNNTPLVAVLLPVVGELSRRSGVSASRLFMPLSFAAILGGSCTLIGTSTNLVVHSLILEHNREMPGAAVPILGMWTIAWVGIPVAVVGLGYMFIFGRRLLPERGGGLPELESRRQYTTAMRVRPGSAVAGRTIEAAGLRGLPGIFLSRIDREDETVIAVAPEEVLREGDTLVFVGVVDSIVDLQKVKGLEPVADGDSPGVGRARMRLIEGVISPSSPLVGCSIRDAGIRSRYGAVVVAVHRHGHRLPGKIGDIVLRPGDTLLLEAAPGFAKQHRHSTEFHLVSELEGAATPHYERAWWAIAIVVLLVALLSREDLAPPLTAALVAAGLMVAGRACTGSQARSAIDWPVILAIGASFAIARAMEKTGLAAGAAAVVSEWTHGAGPMAALAGVYVLTLGFTVLVSNNAAAALAFPIALRVAETTGLGFTPFAVAICLAASCEFMTPLGYQTNLMVMGPGGYRWSDYLRFGGPLTVLCALVALGLLPVMYGAG